MNLTQAKTTQIITTRDFPVHSADVLESYFEIFKNGSGNDLPPVPLVHVDLFKPHFNEPESTLLKKYLRKNPDAKYFLLNGSHRTTAANLARQMIRGMHLETVEDIQKARQIKFKGKPYQHRLLDTIDENIKELVNHFKGTDMFQSVQQKTDRMVDEVVIPAHMIEHYMGSPN